jgi:eukaryotic-like serine/threonine-protein kinase
VRGAAKTARARHDADSRLGDRYLLGERLGSGGMAEVRAAHDERLGRPVAVKLLRPELADAADARRRFEGEARAAAALVHPNIVSVFDVDEDSTRPYLVMERLPGRTLADEIARGPLAPARVVDLGIQVLSALEAAHAAGIVHRDVKSSNVLLAADGTWKVADFGIAKTTESLDVLTSPGEVPCTPGYVAPERLAGKPATAASDLYSVGVVLYEALAGRRPFVADSPLAVAHLARTEDARPLDELRSGLPPELVRVVHRALSRNPSRRYADAAAMREALMRVRDGRRPARTRSAAAVDSGTTMHIGEPESTWTVAPEMIRAAPRPRRAAPKWWNVRTLALAGLAALVIAIVLVLVSSRSDQPLPTLSTPTTAASPPPVASGPRLPGDLETAVRKLEQAVRP